MRKLIIGSGLALGLLLTSFTISNSTEQIQNKNGDRHPIALFACETRQVWGQRPNFRTTLVK